MKTALQGLKTALTSVAAGIAVLAAVPAQANSVNGIVDVWTVGVSGQFLCGTAAFAPGTGGTSCGPTSMSWGDTTGYGQSGLSISNLAAANVNTFGGAYAGTIAPNTSVTHFNQPITGNSLDKVTLESTLTLTPYLPSGGTLAPEVMKFLINFEETTNDPRPSACADGGSYGVGVNANGCADIFVIDHDALNFEFWYDLDGNDALPSQKYYISFFEQTSGLNPLPAAACLAATGSAAPCLGFRTPEQANTTFQFAAMITTTPVQIVPEPGTLATVAAALLALGAVRRRRA